MRRGTAWRGRMTQTVRQERRQRTDVRDFHFTFFVAFRSCSNHSIRQQLSLVIHASRYARIGDLISVIIFTAYARPRK